MNNVLGSPSLADPLSKKVLHKPKNALLVDAQDNTGGLKILYGSCVSLLMVVNIEFRFPDTYIINEGIWTRSLVRGVGFEPTKAYATGWLIPLRS